MIRLAALVTHDTTPIGLLLTLAVVVTIVCLFTIGHHMHKESLEREPSE